MYEMYVSYMCVCMYVRKHLINFQTFLATCLPNTAAGEISDTIYLLQHKILYGQEKPSSKMMTNQETCELRIIGHLLLLSADFQVVNTNFPYSLMNSIKKSVQTWISNVQSNQYQDQMVLRFMTQKKNNFYLIISKTIILMEKAYGSLQCA